jgi:hypothetical protein
MNKERIEYITLETLKVDATTLSKTKWNKIMFFTDLAFYTCDNLDYSDKIYTELDYIKMPYGPIVDNYDVIIDSIVRDNNLQVKKYFGLSSNISQYIEPNGDINNNITVSCFEKNVIDNIISKLINLTASQLSNFSHKLTIWKVPGMYDSIDFKYAKYDNYRIEKNNSVTFYQLVMS